MEVLNMESTKTLTEADIEARKVAKKAEKAKRAAKYSHFKRPVIFVSCRACGEVKSQKQYTRTQFAKYNKFLGRRKLHMKKLEKKRTSRRQSIGKSDPNNDDNTCLQDEEKKHRNNTDHQRKKQKLHNLSDNERITTITMFDDDDNGDENNDNNNNNNDNGSNINNGNDNNNKNNSNDNNNNNNAEKRATVLKPIEGFVEQAPKLMCSKCTQHYIDHHRTHELVRVPIPNTSYPIGAGDSTDNKSSLADADRSGFCYMTHAPKHNIDGIAYYRNFLSPEEAARALAIVESNEWRKDIKRRQQFYGEVYYLTTHHHEGLQPDKGNEKKNVCDLSQFDWLKEKIMGDTWHSRIFGTKEKYDNGDDNDYSNFPTQILVNEYIGNAGIASHFEDEESFGPVIATISLISPTLMTLKKPKEHNNDCEDLHEGGMVKVLMEAGSLFIMSRESRYEWRHGISRAATKVPTADGQLIRRDDNYRRISLTIRHLLKGRRRVKECDDRSEGNSKNDGKNADNMNE